MNATVSNSSLCAGGVFTKACVPSTRHPTIAEWYTWSDPVRDFLRRLAPDLRRFANPPLVEVAGLNDYNRSYSLSPACVSSTPLREELHELAARINALNVPSGLVFLDGMFDEYFDSLELRAFLSLLRGTLVEQAGDPRAALYAPLGKTGQNVGEFALHADLYIPELLINVFDNVPADHSGASVFLAVSELACVLDTIASLCQQQRRQILSFFEMEVQVDRFDELYDLLHGPVHPWTRDLGRSFQARQFQIKLRRGQGYLLHDRTWLHGRAAPAGGVPENRLHRLAFGRSRGATARVQ